MTEEKKGLESQCMLSWKFIIIVFCIAIVVAMFLSFYVGFDAGEKAYGSFLDAHDIICIEKTNPLFSTWGLNFSQGINLSKLNYGGG